MKKENEVKYTLNEILETHNTDGFTGEESFVEESDYQALQKRLEESVIDSNTQRHNFVLEECKARDLQKKLNKAIDGMREIYEVYAGSEGLVEKTAPEAYQAHLITQMKDIAARFLNKDVK